MGVGDFNKKHETIKEIKKLENIKIIKICSGYEHSFAISDSNDIFGWGNNYYGQLGFNDYKNRNLP